MSETPLAIVTKLYAARRSHDLIGMMALCDTAIRFTFNVDPDKVGSGYTYIGIPASLQHMKRVEAEWEQLAYGPGPLRENGVFVRCYISFKLLHRASREILDGKKTQIWTVRGGRITSMEEVFDREFVHAFMRFADAQRWDYALDNGILRLTPPA